MARGVEWVDLALNFVFFGLSLRFFGCTIVISVSKVLMGRLAVSESVLNIINYDISGRLWPQSVYKSPGAHEISQRIRWL